MARGAQNATESSGAVTIVAESPTSQATKQLADPNGITTAYSWGASTAIGGFGGSGLVEERAASRWHGHHRHAGGSCDSKSHVPNLPGGRNQSSKQERQIED